MKHKKLPHNSSVKYITKFEVEIFGPIWLVASGQTSKSEGGTGKREG